MSTCLVLTTTSSIEEARQLAKKLLEAKLAACVSILPQVESHYEWKGEYRSENESQLLIKTLSEKFEAVSEFIQKNHSYEVPEILCLPIEKGGRAYLDWLNQQIID